MKKEKDLPEAIESSEPEKTDPRSRIPEPEKLTKKPLFWILGAIVVATVIALVFIFAFLLYNDSLRQSENINILANYFRGH